jgi:uncharacterized protein YehS (DUF1456 family)
MGLTNNDILKKLRVALKMRDDDIVKVLSLVDFKISKSELGAFLEVKIIRNTWIVKTRF